MTITWGGHATMLIDINDSHILTDPNLAMRMFVLKRYSKPGLTDAELQTVTHTLLSHAHLDHTDKATLRRLPRSTKVFARGKITNIPKALGFPVKSMEWGDTAEHAGVRISCLPVKHFGGRWQINGDFLKYHYASFMIEAGGKTIYFGGDTAYGPHFKNIAKKFPNIDVAILPIGAYEPRWMMHENHVSPEEALQAFIDLGARVMIPMHYGTFKLSREPMDAPPRALLAAAQNASVANKIHILEPGMKYEA
jgi:L-ascorbate metabolism protein UlaG (beta-lactamase superfamily)